ncbi:MAG: bifunctional hydroxymethylpyrimidine kinase/phosphomethylpyrimidine kinase [Wenzhouxiangellaceae bacterium]
MSDVAQKPQTPPAALTIAGSDSSGGAGIQADLKAFAAIGVHGCSAITAITAQNTAGVDAVQVLPSELVGAQISACFVDLPVRAVKTGMLANAPIIEAVADHLHRYRPDADALPVVVDPVMLATSGARLLEPEAVEALIGRLLPLATVLTPNLPEAAALAGGAPDQDPRDLGERLLNLGAAAVLVKGGHADGQRITDWLITPEQIHAFEHTRVPGQHHGTGCALSAAIAAGMARGDGLVEAVDRAMRWLHSSIRAAFPALTGPSRYLGVTGPLAAQDPS